MKKVGIFLICAVFLCVTVPAVAAEGTSQVYDLTALGDNTLVFSAQESPAFWEKPTLKAGEYTTNAGALIVRNSTSSDHKIGLRAVEFPYDNEESLRYLNHLYITVRSGSTVLYEGAYSRINDDRKFSLNTELPAGTQVAYTIDLRCDYTYTGEGLAADELIKWEFYAVTKTEEEQASSPFSDPALLEVLLACGIAVILLAGIFVYDRFIRKRG